ncbi:unnamed protein product [Mytilus edulis]|uniref:Uncharacterized protein n=1 Tax=Mytilus edulis TaxID=6550 RepID=A0A8S3QHJ5_MYTED|nr:unnamed protein product [Mytilus edulis]
MTYKSEITNATVFMSVRTKVKQERISPAVLTQIREELQEISFPAICGSMDKLDIAISFMKSIGVDENMLLSDFIVQTLKMDRTFASNKAQQTLHCKHIQSLWITLALERNLRLHKSGKEPFDNVTSKFKEPLKQCHQTLLCISIKHLRKIQQDLFLELLLECIVLAIDIPQKDEEAYNPAKIRNQELMSLNHSTCLEENCLRCSFADALEAFLYDFPYEDPAPKYDWLKPIINELNAKSDDTLQGCHSVETWKFVLTRSLNC